MKIFNTKRITIFILVLVVIIFIAYYLIIKNKKNVSLIDNKTKVHSVKDNNYTVNVYKNKRTINKLNSVELGDPDVKKHKLEIKNLINDNKNEDEFKITNIKIYNKMEEEKNTYFLNETLYVIFDYELPNGIYFFKILVDIDSKNNNRDAKFTKLVTKRKGSGTSKESPLGFEIFDTNDHSPVTIKKIKIIVYSAGEYELPVHVSVKNVNITLISKFNNNLNKNKNNNVNLSNNEPVGNNNSLNNIVPNSNNNSRLINNKKLIKPISGEKSINKILFNTNLSVADGAQELIDQDEDDCQKLSNELSRIGVLDNSDKVLTLLEPLLPRLEKCAQRGLSNAQEYIDLYYTNLENKQLAEINRNGKMKISNYEILSDNKKNNVKKHFFNKHFNSNLPDLETNNKKNELENELSQSGNLINFSLSKNNNTSMDLSNGKAVQITGSSYTLNE